MAAQLLDCHKDSLVSNTVIICIGYIVQIEESMHACMLTYYTNQHDSIIIVSCISLRACN